MTNSARYVPEVRFYSSASVNCGEPIVFHYTSAAGALGIVQTRELWCTLVHHMNDSTELKYGLQLAREFAGQMVGYWTADKRQRFVAELKDQYERIEKTHIFASSFSEGEDLLSQWRGYAGLNGYSIGFSLDALRIAAARQGFLVGDVAYDIELQRQRLIPTLSKLIAACESHDLVKTNPGDLDLLFWPFTIEVARIAPLIKHKAFSEEREWRVYSDPRLAHYERYEFIARNNEIVPILKLSLENGNVDGREKSLIDICARTFGVGPGANQSQRQDAILSAVNRYGIYWRSGMSSAAPLR